METALPSDSQDRFEQIPASWHTEAYSCFLPDDL